jgi:hypothetical protein
MTDNTQINNGTGDTVRDIDRSANPVPIAAKTQVIQLDAGGATEEMLVNGNDPLPVYDPNVKVLALLQYQTLLVMRAGTNGFVPLVEIPFLVGG